MFNIAKHINLKKFWKGIGLIFTNPLEFFRWSYHYMTTNANPVVIYTEVTTCCTNRCYFCAENKIKREGFIKESVKNKIADIVSSNPDRRFKVYFHVLGEPLLYDGLEGYIKMLSFANAELWLSTNGVFLNNEKIDRLRAAGLKNIWFTMFYTNEADYNKFTRSSNYRKARENLDNLLSRNNAFRRIHIVTFSETADEIEKAIKKKINVTLQKKRTSNPWKHQRGERGSQICVSINGDLTFHYKDYDFELSTGNVCELESSAIMQGYDRALKSSKN